LDSERGFPQGEVCDYWANSQIRVDPCSKCSA
jgi:hypothetical protein